MTTAKLEPLPVALDHPGATDSTRDEKSSIVTPGDDTQASSSHQDPNDSPVSQQLAHDSAELDQEDDDNDDLEIPVWDMLVEVKPKVEPKTEPKTEPATEPHAEPETEPHADPKAEPHTAPETDPIPPVMADDAADEQG
ncbi:hypothetical protein FRC08_000062 [Ceratobasidium sp. 394]|nr:hypothetical protein FRC08_000062 [Ceratobasidium sp. 394]